MSAPTEHRTLGTTLWSAAAERSADAAFAHGIPHPQSMRPHAPPLASGACPAARLRRMPKRRRRYALPAHSIEPARLRAIPSPPRK